MSYLEELYGLKNKIAVVIGGSGTLGGSISHALAQAGARVVIQYHSNREGAEQASKNMGTENRDYLIRQADATDETDLEKMCEDVRDKWGEVDILVNAPGVNSTTPVFEIEEEEWYQILDTNLKSIFLSSRIFARSMMNNKGGSIINISSVSSETPLSKVFTYGISKSGINNMTRFLAREWAENNIRVNALVPGFFPAKQNREILTEERKRRIFNHTPLNRFGEPEELAGAVIWLASHKASSFVTGSLIRVDGGFLAQTI